MASRRSTRFSSVTASSSLNLTSEALESEPTPQQRKKVKHEKSTVDGSNSVMNSIIVEPAVESRSGLLSEYELNRLENIRRNEQFLSNLGLNEAKVSLDAAAKAMDIKPTKRGVPKKTRTLTNVEKFERIDLKTYKCETGLVDKKFSIMLLVDSVLKYIRNPDNVLEYDDQVPLVNGSHILKGKWTREFYSICNKNR